MNNTICKQREDLLSSDLAIPVIYKGKQMFKQLDKWAFCEQPESIEDDEYNVIVNGDTHAKSIDLDFEEFSIDRWYDNG